MAVRIGTAADLKATGRIELNDSAYLKVSPQHCGATHAADKFTRFYLVDVAREALFDAELQSFCF